VGQGRRREIRSDAVSLGTYYWRLARQASYSIAKGLALPLVRRQAVASGQHAMNYPVSTYSPWLTDADFQRAYQTVRHHTLVDVWRCYELWQLLGEVKNVPGGILEVGVWRGGTGALMARRAELLGIDDAVFLCDTWEGVVNSGAIDTYYHDGEHSDTSLETVRELVDQRMGLGRVQVLKGIFPDETGQRVEDEVLRFVHIDVDVYQSAANTFAWAWSRLAVGGIVVFDDYGCPATPGVTQFVDAQRAGTDRLFLHNLNGHAILVKCTDR
jgi:O-methyltransferase